MAKLEIKISAITGPLGAGLRRARGMVQGFGTAIKNVFTSIGAKIAGVFAAGKLISTMRGFIDASDQIGKSASRIGITAEAYQKLAFASRRAGSTTENVERAFKKMQQTIFDSGRGVRTSVDALRALGLSFKDLDQQSPEKQFEIIADRLNSITDATTRAAVAQMVFGRAGTNLLPMISGYREMSKELENMGGVMSNDAVKAAEEFKDAIEDLKTSLQSLTMDSGIIKFFKGVAEGFKALITLEERAQKMQISTEDQGSIFFGGNLKSTASRGSLALEAFKKSRGGGSGVSREERLGKIEAIRQSAQVIKSAAELAAPTTGNMAGTKITDAFQQVGGYLTENRGVSPTNMAELTERTNSILEIQNDILEQVLQHLAENGLTNNVDGAKGD